MPVDYAGASIAQIALRYPTVEHPTVYSVVNPYLSSWDNVIIPGLRQGGLSFEAVPVKEWLDRLKVSDNDVEKNPVKKLAVCFLLFYSILTLTNPCSLSLRSGILGTSKEM